jgi:hypothetical protein
MAKEDLVQLARRLLFISPNILLSLVEVGLKTDSSFRVVVVAVLVDI